MGFPSNILQIEGQILELVCINTINVRQDYVGVSQNEVIPTTPLGPDLRSSAFYKTSNFGYQPK